MADVGDKLYGSIDEQHSIGLRLIAQVDTFLGRLQEAESGLSGMAERLQSVFRFATADIVAQERVMEDTLNTMNGFLKRNAFRWSAWAAGIDTALQLAAKSANEYEKNLSLISQVSTNTQTQASRVFDTIKNNAKGIATESDVAAGALKLLGTSLNPEQIDKFINRTRQAATAMGRSGDEIELVARGLRQWNVNILDNIGVNIRLDRLLQKTARSLGKSEQALTGAETEQAIYNEVIKQTEKFKGIENKLIEDGNFAYVEMQANLRAITRTIGQFVLPRFKAFGKLLRDFTEIIKNALNNSIVQGIIKSWLFLGKVLAGVIAIFTRVNNWGKPLIELLTQLSVVLIALVAPPIIAGVTALAVAFNVLAAALTTFAGLAASGFSFAVLGTVVKTAMALIQGEVTSAAGAVAKFRVQMAADNIGMLKGLSQVRQGIKELTTEGQRLRGLSRIGGGSLGAFLSSALNQIKALVDQVRTLPGLLKSAGSGLKQLGNLATAAKEGFSGGFVSQELVDDIAGGRIAKFFSSDKAARLGEKFGDGFLGQFFRDFATKLEGFNEKVAAESKELAAKTIKATGDAARQAGTAAQDASAATKTVDAAEDATKAAAAGTSRFAKFFGTIGAGFTKVIKLLDSVKGPLGFITKSVSAILKLAGLLFKSILSPLGILITGIETLLAVWRSFNFILEDTGLKQTQTRKEIEKLTEQFEELRTGVDAAGKVLSKSRYDAENFTNVLVGEGKAKRLEELNKQFNTYGNEIGILARLLATKLPVIGGLFKAIGVDEPFLKKATEQLEKELIEAKINRYQKLKDTTLEFVKIFSEEGFREFSAQPIITQLEFLSDALQTVGREGLSAITNLNEAAFDELIKTQKEGANRLIEAGATQAEELAVYIDDLIRKRLQILKTQDPLLPVEAILDADSAERMFTRVKEAGLRATDEQVQQTIKLYGDLNKSYRDAFTDFESALLARKKAENEQLGISVEEADKKVKETAEKFTKYSNEIQRVNKVLTEAISAEFAKITEAEDQEFKLRQSNAKTKIRDRLNLETTLSEATLNSIVNRYTQFEAEFNKIGAASSAQYEEFRKRMLELNSEAGSLSEAMIQAGRQIRRDMYNNVLSIASLSNSIAEVRALAENVVSRPDTRLESLQRSVDLADQLLNSINEKKKDAAFGLTTDEEIEEINKYITQLIPLSRELAELQRQLLEDSTATSGVGAQALEDAGTLLNQVLTNLNNAEARLRGLGGNRQTELELLFDRIKNIGLEMENLVSITEDAVRRSSEKIQEFNDATAASLRKVAEEYDDIFRKQSEFLEKAKEEAAKSTFREDTTALLQPQGRFNTYTPEQTQSLRKDLELRFLQEGISIEDVDLYVKRIMDELNNINTAQWELIGQANQEIPGQYVGGGGTLDTIVGRRTRAQFEEMFKYINDLLTSANISSIINRGNIPTGVGRKSGGEVFGQSGIDKIQARLTAGEYVINKRATEKFKPLLDFINKYGAKGVDMQELMRVMMSSIPGYATGGEVKEGGPDPIKGVLADISTNNSDSSEFRYAFTGILESLDEIYKLIQLFYDKNRQEKTDTQSTSAGRSGNTYAGAFSDLGLSAQNIPNSIARTSDEASRLDEVLDKLLPSIARYSDSVGGSTEETRGLRNEIDLLTIQGSNNIQNLLELGRVYGLNQAQIDELLVSINLLISAQRAIGDNARVRELSAYKTSIEELAVASKRASDSLEDFFKFKEGLTKDFSETDDGGAEFLDDFQNRFINRFRESAQSLSNFTGPLQTGELSKALGRPIQEVIADAREQITQDLNDFTSPKELQEYFSSGNGAEILAELERIRDRAVTSGEVATANLIKGSLGDLLVQSVETRIELVRDQLKKFADLAVEIGAIFGEGLVKGIQDGGASLKEALKQILVTLINFIEKEIILARVKALVESSFNLATLAKSLPQLAAISAAFAAAKAGVQAFAEGGVVTKPTLGLIGEAGEREAVIPLSKLPDMVAKMGAKGGSGDVYINVPINNVQFGPGTKAADVDYLADRFTKKIESNLRKSEFVSKELRRKRFD